MVEWTLTVLYESAAGSLSIIKSILIIIIPVMIIIQIMTAYKWLERLSKRTKWVTDFLGVSRDTLIPLLVGVFAGVAYGASTIIYAKETYGLSKNDIYLTMCFVIPLHSVIETTLVFWILGVNPAIALGSRFLIALTGTLVMKWFLGKRQKLCV